MSGLDIVERLDAVASGMETVAGAEAAAIVLRDAIVEIKRLRSDLHSAQSDLANALYYAE